MCRNVPKGTQNVRTISTQNVEELIARQQLLPHGGGNVFAVVIKSRATASASAGTRTITAGTVGLRSATVMGPISGAIWGAPTHTRASPLVPRRLPGMLLGRKRGFAHHC